MKYSFFRRIQLTLPRSLTVIALGLGVSYPAAGQTIDERGVLLAAPDAVITTEDFSRYLTYRFPDRDPTSALSQEGAVRAAIESIYTVRVIAAVAKKELDEEQRAQADWEAAYLEDRQLMSVYLKEAVEERANSLDFSALAREEYDSNPQRHEIPERRRASHVLVSTRDRSEEEALAIAEQVIDELNAGRPFAEVAAEYSEDPSVATNSGDLGLFPRGRMVPPFEEAVFEMEVGQLSDPVPTNFGYHVIRLTDIAPARTQSFEEVEAQLVTRLRAQRKPGIRQEIVEELKAAAVQKGTVSNPEAIQALEAAYQVDDAASP